MRISQLRIQNYRAFKDETVSLDAYTCFVGPNGSGKSTVLNALNIIFRNTEALSEMLLLDEEDFHLRNTAEPIKITAAFTDLSDQAKEDFKAYVRQDQLVISAQAEWNPDNKKAEVQQFGERNVIRDFARWFEEEKAGAKADQLKQIYAEIQANYPALQRPSSKENMKNALREFEEAHPELCELVKSGDQFYGFSKATNLLERYCQWVYVPAVKDPTQEQAEGKNTALGRLLQRTIRSKVNFKEDLDRLRNELGDRYQELVGKQQSVLEEIGSVIQDRLCDWSHPGARVDLKWHYDESKSITINEPLARARIGEGEFLGDLVRLGHGMQRSFIVALLQVLSSIREGSQPTLILAIEEPELYQHPPQARHLSALLQQISEDEAQVLITTHSPYFISAKGFENVRMARTDGKGTSRITQYKYSELASQIASAMGSQSSKPSSTMAAVEQIMQPSQNELFFSQVPVLVEGPEDIAFLSTHLHLSGRWTEFRKYGCHFILCGGKTNMSRPLAIAEGLGIPAFVVFDGDCDREEKKEQHERDNNCILRLCGLELAPLPDCSQFTTRCVMWKNRIQDDVISEIGKERWDEAETEARQRHGLTDSVKRKNPLLISATVETLWEKGIQINCLEKISENLLNFGKIVFEQR